MTKEQLYNIIRIRILELEDKLMDIIEISSNYENIPVPVFEAEMSEILNDIQIEYLKNVIF